MVVVWVLVGIFVLLFALLAIPLELRFSAAMNYPEQPFRKSGRLRWAFGLVDLPLEGKADTRPRSKPRSKAARVPPPRPKQRGPSRLDFKRLLFNPAFWRRLRSLWRRLSHAIQWRVFRLDARFGLDDPADTGLLWGLASPVFVPLVLSRPNVDIRPVFDEPRLDFHGEGELRIVPLMVIGVLLAFAVSPATWRVLRPALRRG